MQKHYRDWTFIYCFAIYRITALPLKVALENFGYYKPTYMKVKETIFDLILTDQYHGKIIDKKETFLTGVILTIDQSQEHV